MEDTMEAKKSNAFLRCFFNIAFVQNVKELKPNLAKCVGKSLLTEDDIDNINSEVNKIWSSRDPQKIQCFDKDKKKVDIGSDSIVWFAIMLPLKTLGGNYVYALFCNADKGKGGRIDRMLFSNARWTGVEFINDSDLKNGKFFSNVHRKRVIAGSNSRDINFREIAIIPQEKIGKLKPNLAKCVGKSLLTEDDIDNINSEVNKIWSSRDPQKIQCFDKDKKKVDIGSDSIVWFAIMLPLKTSGGNYVYALFCNADKDKGGRIDRMLFSKARWTGVDFVDESNFFHTEDSQKNSAIKDNATSVLKRISCANNDWYVLVDCILKNGNIPVTYYFYDDRGTNKSNKICDKTRFVIVKSQFEFYGSKRPIYYKLTLSELGSLSDGLEKIEFVSENCFFSSYKFSDVEESMSLRDIEWTVDKKRTLKREISTYFNIVKVSGVNEDRVAYDDVLEDDILEELNCVFMECQKNKQVKCFESVSKVPCVFFPLKRLCGQEFQLKGYSYRFDAKDDKCCLFMKLNANTSDYSKCWYDFDILEQEDLMDSLADGILSQEYHFNQFVFRDTNANVFFETLRDKAAEENWDNVMGKAEQSGPHSVPVLRNYLTNTYVRLCHEDRSCVDEKNRERKIVVSGGCMYFNSGLLSRTFSSQIIIRAQCYNVREKVFEDSEEWEWNFPVNAEVLSETDRDIQALGKIPKIAKYFNKVDELTFDAYDDNGDLKKIVCNEHHIYVDGLVNYRIKKYFKVGSDGKYIVDETGREIREQKDIEKLANKIKDEFETAIKKASLLAERNYRLIVPQYRLTTGEIQLLLPIYLGDESHTPQCALVLEKKEAQLEGKTILDLDMAYNNARLLCRPDVFWLDDRKCLKNDDVY